MTEVFSEIILEVYISGTWVDLWPDVLHTPSPKWDRGIKGNNPEDRVGDGGNLTFSLRNDASNSAGLIGYYSPGHANCLSGWTSSLPVRLGFRYDTWTIYKWAGRILPDGILVYPGTNASRRVDVTCEDFMGLAARHKMNLMTARANMYLDTALQAVIDNMPIQPAAVRFDVGISLPFPLAFDISGTETTALGEFQKIAVSSFQDGTNGQGYVVAVGDGLNGETLYSSYRTNTKYMPTPTAAASRVIRADNTDFILLESGDFLLREGGSREIDAATPPTGNEIANFVDADIAPSSVFHYGKDIINHVTVVTTPRKIDASATTVLWTMEQAILIAANEQITLRGAYTDPNGGAKANGLSFADPPVENTDYKANDAEDGTGADMTSSLDVLAVFGASEVELTLKNTHATTDLYVGGDTAGAFFQVRGRGVYTYDTIRVVHSDAASMKLHGVRPLVKNIPYVDLNNVVLVNGGATSSHGETLLNQLKDPRTSVDNLALFANRDVKNIVNFLFLEPRDNVRITESMNALSDASYILQGYSAEIIDGQNVYWNAIFKEF